MLFGGNGGSNLVNPDVLNDTWTWDGQNWHQETPTPSALFLTDALGLVYDQHRKSVVLLGSNGIGGQAHKLNWVSYWDGQSWRSDEQLTFSEGQRPANIPWNEGGQVVYDTSRKAIVLLTMGSSDKPDDPFTNEMWILEGQTWRKIYS